MSKKKRPDLSDLLGLIGFSTLVYGVNAINPAWAFIVAGCILLMVAIIKSTRG